MKYRLLLPLLLIGAPLITAYPSPVLYPAPAPIYYPVPTPVVTYTPVYHSYPVVSYPATTYYCPWCYDYGCLECNKATDKVIAAASIMALTYIALNAVFNS